MFVTAKAYRIWKRLFADPNVWLSIPGVAYDVNMTSREVQAILRTMNSEYIERTPGSTDVDPAIRLTVTDEEFVQLRRDVIMSFNELTDDMLDNIYGALSPIGWVSAADISNVTGYIPAKVCVALSIMDGVA